MVNAVLFEDFGFSEFERECVGVRETADKEYSKSGSRDNEQPM
jgi:hypothetical protein